MHIHSHADGAWSWGTWIVLLPFAAAAIIYIAAALAENGRGRPWPPWRTVLWVSGLGVAALAISGAASDAVDRPFTDHIVRHLLIGMVAPLLLVLAAPVTLALRSFAILPARRLSRALRSAPVQVLGHPVVAALLNVGSLWLLYVTPLYDVTSQSFFHLAVMVHFLATGFLFTAVILPVDPSPHRASFAIRLFALALSLAAHGVLAKALYASGTGGAGALAELMHIPGVTQVDLQTGAQLMFYGGDLVDLALIFLLLLSWQRAGKRRTPVSRRPSPKLTHIPDVKPVPVPITEQGGPI